MEPSGIDQHINFEFSTLRSSVSETRAGLHTEKGGARLHQIHRWKWNERKCKMLETYSFNPSVGSPRRWQWPNGRHVKPSFMSVDHGCRIPRPEEVFSAVPISRANHVRLTLVLRKMAGLCQAMTSCSGDLESLGALGLTILTSPLRGMRSQHDMFATQGYGKEGPRSLSHK